MFFKLGDYGFCCVDFADAYGVNPDAFFVGGISAYFAESLAPVLPVTVLYYDPVQDFRAYDNKSKNVDKIIEEFHITRPAGFELATYGLEIRRKTKAKTPQPFANKRLTIAA
jgi:hypothetical protein